MQDLVHRLLVVWSVPFIITLGGCDAKPECDSAETRKAVLDTVSDDHRNPLVEFAAKNASAKTSLENNTPLYRLGDKLVTTSVSKDKRTRQCSGGISVAVGDVKASKEIEFAVQKSTDGKLSVSVMPFQF